MVQGAAELLPVSSSAHVIVAEKLLGLDPTRPEMTLLLVMLHTGTMVAVMLYFWRAWRENYFSSRRALWNFAQRVAVATVLTGIIGLALKFLIEKFALRGGPQAEIELIFGNLALIGVSLGVVGLLIIYAGLRAERPGHPARQELQGSALIGLVQGLCLPFRGFSRSGATISTGLILGINQRAGGGVQLRPGRGADPAGHRPGDLALVEGPAGFSGSGRRPLPPLLAQSPGHGVQLPGRPAGAPLALPLAGARPLAALRDLLSPGLGHASCGFIS